MRAAVQERGLTSCMNDTKWSELQAAVYRELPFPPPYQRKDVLATAPQPETFGDDVYYLGDWKEGLWPFYSIEWIRIAPRYLVTRARLLPPETRDCTQELKAVLQSDNIPYVEQDRCIWVVGYR